VAGVGAAVLATSGFLLFGGAEGETPPTSSYSPPPPGPDAPPEPTAPEVLVFSASDIEQYVYDYQATYGSPVDAVYCPEDLAVVLNTTTRCSLSHQGLDYGVTVYITNDDPGSEAYDYTIDTEPS
jgi:hypothetical protein